MSDLPEIFTLQSFSLRVCKTYFLINGNSSIELRDEYQCLASRDSLPCYEHKSLTSLLKQGFIESLKA